jgi:hypothetical protein
MPPYAAWPWPPRFTRQSLTKSGRLNVRDMSGTAKMAMLFWCPRRLKGIFLAEGDQINACSATAGKRFIPNTFFPEWQYGMPPWMSLLLLISPFVSLRARMEEDFKKLEDSLSAVGSSLASSEMRLAATCLERDRSDTICLQMGLQLQVGSWCEEAGVRRLV